MVGFRAITVVTYVPAIDPTVSSAGLLTNVLTLYTALNVVALQEKKHVQLSCATCTAPCPAVVLVQVAEQCMALCPYQPAIQRPSWSPLSQRPVGSRLVTAHMPLVSFVRSYPYAFVGSASVGPASQDANGLD